MTEFHHIPVDDIKVLESHREVDLDVVKSIAASIKKLGLLQPITVRKVTKGAYWVSTLVVGRHRLEAVRLLGDKNILARVIAADDIRARLCEITENLHRAELSTLERAEQIEEWRALTADKVAQVEQPLGGAQPKESGISATARELGISRPEVQRSAKIAGITEEAKEAAKEAGLDDNQSALLKVASAPAKAQVAVVEEIIKAKAEKSKRKPATITLVEGDEYMVAAGDDREDSETSETDHWLKIDGTSEAIAASTTRAAASPSPESLFDSIRLRLEAMSAEDVKAFSLLITDFMIHGPVTLAAAA